MTCTNAKCGHGENCEMRDGFASINARFDAQAICLDRQAGLWQAESRWISCTDAWAGKVDATLEAQASEVAELRDEIRRLKQNGQKPH